MVLSAALSCILLISCTPQSGSSVRNDDEVSSVAASSSSPSPAVSSSAAISSSVPKASSAPVSRKTYYDPKTGFTFWHPARLTVIAPKSFTIKTGEVGYEIKSPTIDEGYGVHSVLENISIVLAPDAREKSNGPVLQEDVYSPPGGNLSRHYVLYTGKYRVSVYANYDVYPFFYKGTLKPGESITDVVRRDIGYELKNPIQRLIALYPNEKTLKQFYEDADAIVNSMAMVPTF